MSEFATPSAAAISTGDASFKTKPERPDEDAFKKNLANAEKQHKESMAKFNAVREKLDLAQPKNKDSPTAKRRQELIAQLTEIRKQQGASKTGRNQVFDQIKKLDEQLKSRIAEQKVARSRVSFKSVDEIDREIERLDKQVDGGMMKLVDEKKALAEISSLRKQRKNFSGFDDAQKGIDDTKAKIKELRDTLDDPETKAMSEKYNKIQAELDTIKAEQDEAYKNINSLRDERTKLHAEQQEKYANIKKIKDDYYQGKKAFFNYESEARKKALERKQAEREAYEKEKRKERAQRVLEEASDPAYLDEIRRAESLLRYLDPSYVPTSTVDPNAGKFTAQAQRTVDDSGLKGTRVVRKDEREEDYFAGKGGKKGKKGRKTEAAPAKFSVPPAVLEDCSFMNIEPPMNAGDVPATVEKVKAKLDNWKADQKSQTEKNIAKAKKDIEKLEAEETGAAAAESSAPATNGHGETKATAGVEEGGSVANEVDLIKSATADVAADLEEASIEDKA